MVSNLKVLITIDGIMRLGSEHEKHAKQQRHPGENVQRLGVAFVGVFQEKQMQQRECSCVA